jgi:predicted polyphosphate/ATP-dependent NAD kinase
MGHYLARLPAQEKRMRRLGLVVNPLAGLGGRVGLKGSDGSEIQQLARQRGAVAEATARTVQALAPLRAANGEWTLLTPPGVLGETAARAAGLAPRCIGAAPVGETTAADSRRSACELAAAGVELLLFAGGDGTARDICAAVGLALPCLGIPAGVKIYSTVFAVNPPAAGRMALDFLSGQPTFLEEGEVLDLDEDAFRAGAVAARLYGVLHVPHHRTLRQQRKVASPASLQLQCQAIAASVRELLERDTLYVLGPGTTTAAIAAALGAEKTLVGVDLYRVEIDQAGLAWLRPEALDVGESQLRSGRRMNIILTPTGGQGFLLGRGNQQLSPTLLRQAGRDQLLVVAPAAKLAGLRGSPLRVDTGDPALDATLAGPIAVITGYRERAIYPIGV